MAERRLGHSLIPAEWWHNQEVAEWRARPLLAKRIRENAVRGRKRATHPENPSGIASAR